MVDVASGQSLTGLPSKTEQKSLTIKSLLNSLFKFQNDFFAKYLLTISAIVGGYLLLIVFDDYSNHQHRTVCLFKLATGIPCPGCGMGRATLEIVKGNFLSSFKYHILCIPFTITVIVSLVWMSVDLFRRKETFFPFINKDIRLPYKILLFSLIAVSWVLNFIRQV